jgi:hypothetical protein
VFAQPSHVAWRKRPIKEFQKIRQGCGTHFSLFLAKLQNFSVTALNLGTLFCFSEKLPIFAAIKSQNHEKTLGTVAVPAGSGGFAGAGLQIPKS